MPALSKGQERVTKDTEQLGLQLGKYSFHRRQKCKEVCNVNESFKLKTGTVKVPSHLTAALAFQMYARELRLQRENVQNVKHTESHVQLKLDAPAGAARASGQPLASQSAKGAGPTAEALKRVSALAICD